MGFIRLNQELLRQRKITLENTFVIEYMPHAPENYTKVYLMGLAMSAGDDNDLAELSLALNLDASLITEAFSYWQVQGLVNMTVDPLSVEYLPVVPYSRRIKKYSKEKYKDFNDQLHLMIKDRIITPNEYNEYYDLIETYHMEYTALLTIIGYCVRLKGANITYPYILTVAKNLIGQGCYTYDRVQEKLSEMDLYDADLRAVLKSLGLKRNADYNDRSMLLKWKNEFGFNMETIIGVAKQTKKGGIQTLDMLMHRYFEHKLFSIKEIDDFNSERSRIYEMTGQIIKILGQRYSSLDHVIDTYVSGWIAMGFTGEVLYNIADYCFKTNIKDLDGMNHAVAGFYKQGLISSESINSFLLQSIAIDNKIMALFNKMGLSRLVTSRDRDFYKTWTVTWKISDELLSLAAETSLGKLNPVAYMNTILASWHEKGIVSVTDAKATINAVAQTAVSSAPQINQANQFVNRAISSQELNAMFERLKDEEL